jgi:excinuclease ABC subunit A
VTVLVHRLSEIDTPAFRTFLEEAVAAFNKNLARMRTKPEDLMPWKLNGERWHLGDKGFPPGRKVRWERPLLARLLDLVRAVEPQLEVRWDARDAITLKVPGVSRGWAQWRTKDSEGLDCRFLGKKGQFNLSQLEGLGVSPEITHHRGDGDMVHLLFQHDEHVQPQRLKELLREHLRGFREMLSTAAAS